MPIGEKIQALRTTKGWSQDELADKLNTNGPQVSRWENGNTPTQRRPYGTSGRPSKSRWTTSSMRRRPISPWSDSRTRSSWITSL